MNKTIEYFSRPILVEVRETDNKVIQEALDSHIIYAAMSHKEVAQCGNKPGLLCFCICHPKDPWTGWLPFVDEINLTKELRSRN